MFITDQGTGYIIYNHGNYIIFISVKKAHDAGMLPLECAYLSKNAMLAVAGQAPQTVKHFALKRKPKSAALRAELLHKCKIYNHSLLFHNKVVYFSVLLWIKFNFTYNVCMLFNCSATEAANNLKRTGGHVLPIKVRSFAKRMDDSGKLGTLF